MHGMAALVFPYKTHFLKYICKLQAILISVPNMYEICERDMDVLQERELF